MEMARIVLSAGFFGIASLSFCSFSMAPDGITITSAQLLPMGEGLAFVATIENPGEADRLTGIGSDSAGQAILVGAESVDVPADGAAQLTLENTHGMLLSVHGGVTSGQRIAVTLWFENSGRVTTKARVSDTVPAEMSDVPNAPAPSRPERSDLIHRL